MVYKGSAFLKLEDIYGNLEIIVFPRTYEKYRTLIAKGTAVIIKGLAQVSERERKLIASDIYSIDQIADKEEAKKYELWLLYDDAKSYKDGQNHLNVVLKQHLGYTPVYIQLKAEKKAVKAYFETDLESGVEKALQLELGSDRVLVRKKKE
jgi:DNA polymerase-3 subunit alpha